MTKAKPLHGIRLTRRDRLRELVRLLDGPAVVARKAGYSGPSYISQLTAERPTRPITEGTARHIEASCGLPPLWLDGVTTPADAIPPAAGPPRAPPPDLEKLIVGVVLEVGRTAKALGLDLPPDKFAEAVALGFQQSSAAQDVDTAFIQRLLKLAG